MNDIAKGRKPNVAIIAGPVDKVGELLLDSLLKVLIPLSNEIFVVTTNLPHKYERKVHIIEAGTFEGWTKRRSLSFRVIRLLLAQLRFSLALLRLYKSVDLVLFHLGEYVNILPSGMFKTNWEKKCNFPFRRKQSHSRKNR